MRRVISLFREPEELYGRSEPQEAPCKGSGNPEPLYFVQLLEYLRQRREAIEADQRESASAQQN